MQAIRLAVQENRAEVEAVAEDAYSLYLERMDKKPFPMLDDYEVHISGKHVHVLEEQGRIVAYVVLIPEDDKTLLLDNIGVRSCFQKKGYGKKLTLFAERWAKERGYGRIILYTDVIMHENLAWYPALDYTQTHRVQKKGYDRVYFEKNV